MHSIGMGGKSCTSPGKRKGAGSFTDLGEGSCKIRVHWRRPGVGSIEAPHWLSPGHLSLAELLLGEEDSSSHRGSEVASLPVVSPGSSLSVGVRSVR